MHLPGESHHRDGMNSKNVGKNVGDTTQKRAIGTDGIAVIVRVTKQANENVKKVVGGNDTPLNIIYHLKIA